MSKAETICVNYSRGFGWSGDLFVVLRREPGVSSVTLTYNFDRGREIGRYETVLGDQEFRRVTGLLHDSGYLDLPRGRFVSPETTFVNIAEQQSGEQQMMGRSFALPELPPKVAELRDEFEQRVIPAIRRHPHRVLAGKATWHKPVFSPNDDLEVRVELLNVGPLPIEIGNPLHSSDGWNGLTLALRGTPADVGTAKLDHSHVRVSPRASTSELAHLVPGGVLAFSIAKRGYVAPGEYEGRLTYRNVTDNKNNPHFLSGELVMPLGPVKIA